MLSLTSSPFAFAPAMAPAMAGANANGDDVSDSMDLAQTIIAALRRGESREHQWAISLLRYAKLVKWFMSQNYSKFKPLLTSQNARAPL